MNKDQSVEQSAEKIFPTFVQLAAVEVFNIVFNIYFIINKKKYILCFCSYNNNINNIKCLVCRISLFSFGWFKSQGRRDRKYLIDFCIKFLKAKQEVIDKVGHRIIYFNKDYEYTFFAGKLPENIRLLDVAYPKEILF